MNKPKPKGPIKTYFSSSRSPLYSYLISLPLLLLYEVLITISQPDTHRAVRVSVDVWFRTLLSYFGHNVLSITLILVALFGLYIIYRERDHLSELRLIYFLIMLVEAFCYAFLLALLLSTLVNSLLAVVPPSPVQSLSTLQQFALSFGAGLFEELFFRVILVSGLLFVFKHIFTKRWLAYSLAMLVAALLFSLVHYLGVMGDVFALRSFLFRFLFGLALNGIYLWRGFGTAAWTHAIYDIMVIVYS